MFLTVCKILSFNRSTNAGQRLVERDIEWGRLRIPPPKTFLVDYYEYNNLNDLKPGDHIEIQKRRRRASPYHGKKIISLCEFKYIFSYKQHQ